jgi:hypothetical protein
MRNFSVMSWSTKPKRSLSRALSRITGKFTARILLINTFTNLFREIVLNERNNNFQIGEGIVNNTNPNISTI